MRTRDRILDTALQLFNDSGTAAVSTNHIAEALGISPGNLYYHFRNKDEIIRGIFEQLFELWDRIYTLPDDQPPTTDDLQRLVRANFEAMWQYRFVYRELAGLLRRDEVLHARYLAVRERGFTGFRELVAAFTVGGIFVALEAATVTRLAELCWLISEFWLANVEVAGQCVDAAQMEHGVELMMQVLEPFISDE